MHGTVARAISHGRNASETGKRPWERALQAFADVEQSTMGEHALEARIEGSRRRLLDDIKRASRKLHRATSGAKEGLSRAAIATGAVSGLLVIGVVAAVLVRRRRRR
jgi:hypothetical protein